MTTNGAGETPAIAYDGPTIHMESINRLAQLPTVEQTVQVATSIYSVVKDCSAITNWSLSTAESTAYKTIQIGKPIVSQFEGPIKRVDDLLCSGLDYVEDKVPAVKLPPGEIFFQIYTNTKDYVNSKIQPAVKTALDMVQPAVDAAKPTVNSLREIAEPYVQPAVDKACAITDYGRQKVGQILHLNQDVKSDNSKQVIECQECVENAEKPKSIHSE
ncbi:hypothetical protein FQR65_LT11456 [Abscondita terminalis]|nr:hypothetical protein FQR65_LT11456 [Abscondita terminalis]